MFRRAKQEGFGSVTMPSLGLSRILRLLGKKAYRSSCNIEAGKHALRFAIGRPLKHLRNLSYGLLSEVRSFRGHTRILLSTRLYQEGLLLEPPPALKPTEYETYRNRLETRMRDMRNLESNRPWVGLVDAQLFLTGWDKGAEFALGMGSVTLGFPDKRLQELNASHSPSEIKQGSNFMPPPLAPQDSKRDPQSPLA